MSSIIFFLLFILPFLALPFGISPFETPKVYVAELGMILLILWYLAGHPFRSLLERKYIPYGLLAVLGILHFVLSPSNTLLFGNAFRLSGTFLFLLLLIFSVISSQIAIKIPSVKLIVGLLITHLILAVIIQGKLDYRAIGTLGEANSLAANTIFLLPFLFRYDKQKRERFGLVKSLGLCAGFATILFTGSRSGIIALLILGVFYLLQRYSLKAAVISSFVLLAVSFSLPFLQTNQVFENRGTVWQTAFVAGMQKPILGWGVGNTEIALRSGASQLENVIRFEYVDHSHNLLLETLVQLGILGLILIISLLVYAIRNCIQKNDAITLALLLGLLTMVSFNPLSVVLLVQFWWVVGQGIGEKKQVKKS